MSTTRTFSASAHCVTIAITFSLAAFVLLPFGVATARAAPPAAAMPQPGSVAHLRVEPNPFNPTTTIRFEVEAPAGTRPWVCVEIFDLQGRLVRTLLDESLPPGPREVNWHADTVSGVYLARVTAGADTAVAKLTLLE